MLPATEELHAKQRKDYDEEEEEEDEGDDGLHGVHQRDNQVSQRCPVPWQSQNIKLVEKRFFKKLYGTFWLQRELYEVW